MNLKLKLLALCAIMVVTVVGCKKVFLPNVITEDSGYLVVEGVINSGADSTIIKLSRTVKLDNINRRFEKGAIVTVESDRNDQYPLVETAIGTYSATRLNLPTDRKYRLHIFTAGNKEYLSDFVENKITPQIDSVSYQPDDKGVQFYMYSHDDAAKTRYYRWDYDETWSYFARYDSFYEYDRASNKIIVRSADSVFSTCYHHATPSNNIFLRETTKLSRDVISRIPVGYADAATGRLAHVYSFNIKQYALTQDAYNYWSELRKNTEKLGSIFDALPSSSLSNLHSVSNPSEPVIGFISASTITSKRVFVNGRDLPFFVSYQMKPTLEECPKAEIPTEPANLFDERLRVVMASGDYILTAPDQDKFTFKILGYIYAPKQCVDCRLQGGTITKPEYWP